MSDATPHLGLPLIAAAQAQKHVTHNEALALLDALVQLACLDKDLPAPPPSPSEGDRYLVAAASPSGAWAGLSGQVVRFQDGVWTGSAPRPGWFAYVIDEADLYIFDGNAWTSFRRAITAIQVTSRLGINTDADAVNRLALKAEGALLSWDDATPGSGSMRVAVNKQAPARDAGLVFQTGYSARALIGTLGADDFSLKVSGDGASYATALTASAATGGIDFSSTETALASAATVDLGAAGTRRVAISGSAAITGFGSVPNRERFLRFAGGATLTHDAVKLVLPTRANIVTAADDTCLATSDASGNWRVRHYQRADGTPLAGASTGGAVASVAGRTGAVTLASADLADATALGRGLVAATSAASARAGLSAAASGANADITALTGLTTALSVGQGGTGAATASQARAGLGAAASGANADITALAGPALGAATAATAAPGTNTAQVATTAFVAASFLTSGSAAATYAPLASPALSGVPTAPTAAVSTATTQVATTAFVLGQAGTASPLSAGTAAPGTASLFARQDHVHPTDATRAPLASPAFTGTPSAPTAAADTGTTQLATTAFVLGQAGTAAPAMNGTAAAGTAARYARADHVHPTDASLAPLASPALTGTPTAPNAAAGTNTAQIATTSFVAASFVTYAYAAASYATIASPTLTGTPAAPTPAAGDVSTRLATTAFVAASYAALASPAFTGTPSAPTAASAANSTQIATTAYADRAAAAGNLARTQVNDAAYTVLATDRVVAVIALTAPRTLTLPAAGAFALGAILLVMDESGACSAASPITLARTGSSDTINGAASAVIASAYGYLALQSNGSNKWTVVDAPAPVASVAGRTGAVTLAVGDVSGAAPLASPALTGTPTAPNAAAGTNTAQVATTSFVAASFVTYAYAGATYATAANATLTGTPIAPTPAARDNSTRLATTAYADRGDAAAVARTQVNDAAYTVTAADRTVAVIALSAARTLTLPAASAYPQGTTLAIFDESGACSWANAITVARAGTDTISGLTLFTIVRPYGFVALQSNGSNKWTVVDRDTLCVRPTFIDVAKSANQSIGAAFTRITMGTVNQDTGGNWDGTNNWYTCPRSGIYQITGSIRVYDGTATGSTYSCGVYTSETDGPWHLWTGVGPNPASRATFAYSRLSYQAAGDRLRMFAFSDASGGVTITAAGLQIMLVSEAA